MKLYQKITSYESACILKVDSDSSVELMGRVFPFYSLRYTFKLSLDSKKKIEDYDRVVVTTKRKETPQRSITSLKTNLVSPVKSLLVNSTSADSTVMSPARSLSLKPNNGLPVVKLPPKVQDKLYSGLKILKDLEVKEEYLDRKEVNISSSVEDAVNSYYEVTELAVPEFKPRPKESREASNKFLMSRGSLSFLNRPVAFQSYKIDPKDVIDRINREVCDITSPVNDHFVSSLTSETNLDHPDTRSQFSRRGLPPLYFDIAKYYLDDVPKSPKEEESTYYETKKTVKKLSEVEVPVDVFVLIDNKNSNLTVRFDLYKRGTNVVDETLSIDVFLPSHVEAFDSIKNAPEVRVSEISTLSPVSSRLPRVTLFSHNVEIIDKEKKGKIKSFNVYMKSIQQIGTVSPYKKVSNVKNDSKNSLMINLPSDLCVLRVVPVDSQNKESNVYTNVVIGPGYDSIGALSIVASHFGGSSIQVDVHNIPKSILSLTLYKRDCTNDKETNSQTQFEPVRTIRVQPGSTVATFKDENIEWSHIYEYYVYGLRVEEISQNEVSCISNFAVLKAPSSNSPDRSITVSLSNFSTTQTASGDLNFSFDITTQISESENERITNSLKDQLGELYDQYLSPANNASSPLGDNNGVPQYSDIFYHEIVRTNINTGERESFDLVTDGQFQDNYTTQKVSNVKPVNPLFEYMYQVFTFKKNPIEIFKKYIAAGTAVNGRQWFYRPYKWRMKQAMLGRLYPDDTQGMPIVDAYEAFTSEAFGMTASYKIDGSVQHTSISQVLVDRIDRDTVKVTWEFEGVTRVKNIELYDSFVVMKVVNGVRSFVGTTQKNYIYHELTSKDLGTVYYIIVPIMAEFDIDAPGYSSTIVIGPEGLTEKTKSSYVSSFLKRATGSTADTSDVRKNFTGAKTTREAVRESLREQSSKIR